MKLRQAAGSRSGVSSRDGGPTAVVMGDVDLVWPLALAHIPCAVLAPPGSPVRWSRRVQGRLPWIDAWERPDALLDALLRFAEGHPQAPVLMPQRDPDLLLISRNRDRLGSTFRFLLADAELIESLVDKSQFLELAERLDLPVPSTRLLAPVADAIDDLGLEFPVVIKPALRQDELWHAAGFDAKAIHVESHAALAQIWPQVMEVSVEVLAQEAVSGPETSVESYHAYVDPNGDLVAGFTGRKIRTRPSRYGHSTAVEITAAEDVARLGRELVATLGLKGVAKFDFKRAPDGSLHLLEINPRFTLWHHPAALADVNIPALYYADLTGRARPSFGPARAGVRWCMPPMDVLAVRAEGGSVLRWAWWAAHCEALYSMSRWDPLPVFPGWIWATARRLLSRIRGRAAGRAAH